jgi:hypothetical protein
LRIPPESRIVLALALFLVVLPCAEVERRPRVGPNGGIGRAGRARLQRYDPGSREVGPDRVVRPAVQQIAVRLKRAVAVAHGLAHARYGKLRARRGEEALGRRYARGVVRKSAIERPLLLGRGGRVEQGYGVHVRPRVRPRGFEPRGLRLGPVPALAEDACAHGPGAAARVPGIARRERAQIRRQRVHFPVGIVLAPVDQRAQGVVARAELLDGGYRAGPESVRGGQRRNAPDQRHPQRGRPDEYGLPVLLKKFDEPLVCSRLLCVAAHNPS